MAGIGPAPKPASKRRRRTKPATYGAAEPVTALAAHVQERTLGIENPHRLVADMWAVVQESAEARFYSEADWARLSMELWFANAVLTSGKPISGQTWAAVQHGLTELLISPAAKRRAAIELQPPGPDTDEIAAVSMIGKYRQSINDGPSA
jgi:hypothetical protein